MILSLCVLLFALTYTLSPTPLNPSPPTTQVPDVANLDPLHWFDAFDSSRINDHDPRAPAAAAASTSAEEKKKDNQPDRLGVTISVIESKDGGLKRSITYESSDKWEADAAKSAKRSDK